MGILRRPETMIRWAVTQGHLKRGFAVCELGDQIVTHTDPHYPARALYEELDCGRYEAIDGNARGTLTIDLNQPIEEWMAYADFVGKFNLVTDFGTGEHVFDQAQVWRTLHKLCAPGALIAYDRPISGYAVHGFYAINECLIRDLAAANAYDHLCGPEWEKTKRGKLMRGVMRTPGVPVEFKAPQQGRYKKLLRPITENVT